MIAVLVIIYLLVAVFLFFVFAAGECDWPHVAKVIGGSLLISTLWPIVFSIVLGWRIWDGIIAQSEKWRRS